MRVKDIPEFKDRNHLLMLDENLSVQKATKEMKKHNYGSALVTHKGKLCGIFTERDVLMKVVATGKRAGTVKLKDVMTSKLKTINEEDTVHDAMDRMFKGHFRHLPVVNNNGDVTGMVSQGDFVAMTWHQVFHQLKTQAKDSFLSYTQLWMILFAALAYLTFMMIVL